jgi:predicted acetyltransferase
LGKKSTEKIFKSSQTFFNLTNKTKIIPVINYFRKKGNKMIFSLRERREINNQNAVKFFNKENINIMNFGNDLELKSKSIL